MIRSIGYAYPTSMVAEYYGYSTGCFVVTVGELQEVFASGKDALDSFNSSDLPIARYSFFGTNDTFTIEERTRAILELM